MNKEDLLLLLYRAYKGARLHKRGRAYQLKFEQQLENNLVLLRDELWARRYKVRPATCFIIHEPKMREVFAADFRDRIVHHLFYNLTHVLFERTFIPDSYSCITGRGTHYGIHRLRHHILSASDGYSRPCYVMKTDISGYFMHIHRGILLRTARHTLETMRHRPSDTPGLKWSEAIDYDLVLYLLQVIIEADPTEACIRLGDEAEWDLLPREKSLFHSPPNCGLPIGNLSSQLFSNIYLNEFDQYVKRELGCRHYGRYVDDAYFVGNDKRELVRLLPLVRRFLNERLKLSLSEHKVQICDVRHGVEFLGAFLKPYRTYVSHKGLRRIERHLRELSPDEFDVMQSIVNSCLGVLSHYDSFHCRRVLCARCPALSRYGRMDAELLHFTPLGK